MAKKQTAPPRPKAKTSDDPVKGLKNALKAVQSAALARTLAERGFGG